MIEIKKRRHEWFSAQQSSLRFLPRGIYFVYHIVPGLKAKNIILIVASLVFYSFGQPEYLFLLLVSVFINYAAGWALTGAKYRKGILAVAVLLNVGLLSVFKYLDFAMDNINSLFGMSVPLPGIVLPIGISFYTFQGMSYIIDVYRDRFMGTRNFAKLILYISFFPQLIAGPIIKYHDVAAMIDSRECTAEKTASGLRRFIIGLSKKLLLANTAGAVADQVFALDAGSLDIRIAWLGAVCYTLQIYFDFSGYSDMAIGMGRIFGLHFLENFNYPYISTTIQELLGEDGIFLCPLGFGTICTYLWAAVIAARCGRFSINLSVFFTTGLWHGANWTFVLWGLWRGIFSMLEDIGIIPRKKIQGRIVGHIYTLLIVILGFTLFRAETLSQAGIMFSQMFAGFGFTPETDQILHDLLSNTNIVMIILSIVLSVDWLPRIRGRIRESFRREASSCGQAYLMLRFLYCLFTIY